MSSKLLGALALGVGSNALLSGLQNRGPMAGKPPAAGQAPMVGKGPMSGQTPGFFGDVGQAAKKGFQSGVQDLAQQGIQQGLQAVLGFEEGGAVYKDSGGWFDAIVDRFRGPSLAQAQARADQLNRANEQLGIDAQLEATTDQNRLGAQQAEILAELGLAGQRATAIGDVLQGTPGKVFDRTARLQQAAETAGVADQLPTELPTAENTIRKADLLLAPLQLDNGGLVRSILGAEQAIEERQRKALEALNALYGGPPKAKAAPRPVAPAPAPQVDPRTQPFLDPLPMGYGADEAGRYATGGTALARKKNMPDGYTGATKKAPRTEDEVVDGKFLSDHVPHVKKQGVKVGPLAKAVYKNEGGAVREMHYHNPLMAKPAGGKSEEK